MLTARKTLSLMACCLFVMMVGGCGSGRYNDTVVNSFNRLTQSLDLCMHWLREHEDNTSSFKVAELQQASKQYSAQLQATQNTLLATTPPSRPEAHKFHNKLSETVEELAKLAPLFQEMTASISKEVQFEKGLKNRATSEAYIKGIRIEVGKQDVLSEKIEQCIGKADKLMDEVQTLHRQMADALDINIEIEKRKQF